MAVAAAAALAAAAGAPSGAEFLRAAASYIPQGTTKERILEAAEIAPDDLPGAIRRLGTGQWVTAQDTAPFCLWVAAYHLANYEEALWRTVAGDGDADTTCAIVGGIVALSAREIPAEWLARREPLPAV
jgi:ADP-ribosylglycohydrolase